jgi:hypothetical protein
MQRRILEEFERELQRSKQPGWRPVDLGYELEEEFDYEVQPRIQRREESHGGNAAEAV